MNPMLADFLRAFERSAVSLPACEVLILLGVMTVCLLFRWNRAGLVVAYLDAYRWGWLFFRESFGAQYPLAMLFYYVFGGFVLLLFLIGMFLGGSRND